MGGFFLFVEVLRKINTMKSRNQMERISAKNKICFQSPFCQKEHQMKNIKNRQGQIVPFKAEKISNAIQKSLLATGTEKDVAGVMSCALAGKVVERLQEKMKDTVPGVEDIQDCVEKTLIEANMADAAKAYILYRRKHQLMRESSNSLNDQLREIFDSSSIASDLKRDNANIDGDSAMGTMLQVGAAASKSFYAANYLTEEEAAANRSGDIHIHDFDFYALTETCCQIDFKALAARGFSTGHGFIRPPQSIQSYAALACIAIQANQNDQHGGQSIPNFDYAMAEGVRKTFRKELSKHLEEALMLELIRKYGQNDVPNVNEALTPKWAEKLIADTENECGVEIGIANAATFSTSFAEAIANKMNAVRPKVCGNTGDAPTISGDTMNCYVMFAIQRAVQETEKATHQAMESLIHNLNSMHSRAGAQVPFSSLNYGTDTSAEGRMVIRQLLLATNEGLGNGETPIFPIQIFKVKEGVNYNEDDPNYDLFKLSMKVSAKRLFPNYVFLDAPFNLQYYVPGRPETEVATMGCRTRVMGNVHNPATTDENGEYHPNGEIAYGRGNLSFTSVNLPRLAILANGNEQKFFESLEKTMELVAQQLLHRLEIQSRRHVYNYPFLMGQGVWMGSEKLGPLDEVGEVLKNGSLSIGFIGLAETLVALYGHHHGENDEMQEKGLAIIRFMREFCDNKANDTKLNFTLLATPAEGLSGYFVRKDKKLFGEIAGVTDKDYYTNSFHIPVWYSISAFEKIQKEAPYHALCNAGHISYVELDGEVSKNPEAFEAVVRCMHDNGIGYGSINHPVDRDPVCGYVGVIGDVCPRCGRHDGEGITEEKLNELRKQYPNMPAFIGVI